MRKQLCLQWCCLQAVWTLHWQSLFAWCLLCALCGRCLKTQGNISSPRHCGAEKSRTTCISLCLPNAKINMDFIHYSLGYGWQAVITAVLGISLLQAILICSFKLTRLLYSHSSHIYWFLLLEAPFFIPTSICWVEGKREWLLNVKVITQH